MNCSMCEQQLWKHFADIHHIAIKILGKWLCLDCYTKHFTMESK